ncbi:hypothetical protein EYF80_049698 [Liparis tanakae]|uniref:Fibronectin type-III domain-containing protein n=1 Tax=Liparis tanakae TaxID=230148 RepID=A0A4Z2FG16_9TELE|nr:hypothetical protein EYF80_049698 [Liparis tanakae]
MASRGAAQNPFSVAVGLSSAGLQRVAGRLHVLQQPLVVHGLGLVYLLDAARHASLCRDWEASGRSEISVRLFLSAKETGCAYRESVMWGKGAGREEKGEGRDEKWAGREEKWAGREGKGAGAARDEKGAGPECDEKGPECDEKGPECDGKGAGPEREGKGAGPECEGTGMGPERKGSAGTLLARPPASVSEPPPSARTRGRPSSGSCGGRETQRKLSSIATSGQEKTLETQITGHYRALKALQFRLTPCASPREPAAAHTATRNRDNPPQELLVVPLKDAARPPAHRLSAEATTSGGSELISFTGASPIREEARAVCTTRLRYIQPTPPRQPEIRDAPETFNITWRSGYEGHRYLKGDLDYDLLLQTQSSGTRTSRLKSLETSASVPRSRLPPGATLCVKVRSKPNNKRDYGGTWSAWSPSACRENEAGKEEEDNLFVVLIRSLGPVCAAVGVTLFVLRRPAKWLSPQGEMELTYKTEEVLTADAVTVEPKPATTDPEENRAFHDPTVPLGVTQCQSSYIGLPGVHWASPPPGPTLSPGETSPAAPPRPVWGVGAGEVEVVSALPADVFSACSSDSGCSFEEPTQSPECSSPNRPPPPCFWNDYCVLNKTDGGFSPVLVSGGSGPAVPTGSLQEE